MYRGMMCRWMIDMMEMRKGGRQTRRLITKRRTRNDVVNEGNSDAAQLRFCF